MKIRFNLKQVSEKNKLTQIMLVTTINKRRIRVYTKLRVEPQYWNHEIYRCYQNGGLNIRERLRLKYINEQIDNLVTSLCEMDEQLAMKGEYLSAAVVRQIVDKNQQKEQLLQNPIACLRRLVGEYEKNVNRKGKRGIESTKATYLTALGRLEDYDNGKCRSVRSTTTIKSSLLISPTTFTSTVMGKPESIILRIQSSIR